MQVPHSALRNIDGVLLVLQTETDIFWPFSLVSQTDMSSYDS